MSTKHKQLHYSYVHTNDNQDRYYVRYHSLPTLEDAGLRHFKSLVFDVVKRDVTSAMLDLVNSVCKIFTDCNFINS